MGQILVREESRKSRDHDCLFMDMDGKEVEGKGSGEERETKDFPLRSFVEKEKTGGGQEQDTYHSHQGTLPQGQHPCPLEYPFRTEPEGCHLQLIESPMYREYGPKHHPYVLPLSHHWVPSDTEH